MARVQKYTKQNKNYFLSELDEQTLAVRKIVLRIIAVAAAIVYVPFILLYIIYGYKAPGVMSESYDGLSAYLMLTFALPVSLIWCAVMSFLSYSPKRETLERKSPPFGFRLIPYVGILVELLLSLAFAVYHTILAVIAGGNVTDFVGAAVLWVCFALAAAYYVLSFITYRASVLIEIEPDDIDESKRVALPTFHLSDEEIEQGKSAFAPPEKDEKDKPKNKKQK